MFRVTPTNQGTWGVASDGTNVYFTTQGVVSSPAQLLSVPSSSPTGGVLATPTVVPVATTGTVTSLNEIVVDSASPYLFLDQHTSPDVYASPKLGSGKSAVGDTLGGTVVDVAISGNNGYALTFAGVVLQPLPSGAATVLAPTVTTPTSIVADQNNVYWTDAGNVASAFNNGTIQQVPLAGGAVTTLASGQGYVNGIGVDANNVYFVSDNTPPFVAKIPIGGNTVTILANLNDPSPITGSTCCSGVSNVVSDGKNVYFAAPNFTTGTGGQIWAVPAAGGPAFVYADDPNGPAIRMAMDSNNLYWTTGTTVEKVPLL